MINPLTKIITSTQIKNEVSRAKRTVRRNMRKVGKVPTFGFWYIKFEDNGPELWMTYEIEGERSTQFFNVALYSR